MSENEWREILLMEHDAAIGSFVASFRFHLKWDNEKFIRLCWALHQASKRHRGDSALPRDLSQSFWWCGTFVPFWIEQTDFRVGQRSIDYDKAKTLLRDLGDEWFGEGNPLTDAEIAERLAAVSRT